MVVVAVAVAAAAAAASSSNQGVCFHDCCDIRGNNSIMNNAPLDWLFTKWLPI